MPLGRCSLPHQPIKSSGAGQYAPCSACAPRQNAGADLGSGSISIWDWPCWELRVPDHRQHEFLHHSAWEIFGLAASAVTRRCVIRFLTKFFRNTFRYYRIGAGPL
jgi:hypothetical protein